MIRLFDVRHKFLNSVAALELIIFVDPEPLPVPVPVHDEIPTPAPKPMFNPGRLSK
jgi:hypothetical protein